MQRLWKLLGKLFGAFKLEHKPPKLTAPSNALEYDDAEPERVDPLFPGWRAYPQSPPRERPWQRRYEPTARQRSDALFRMRVGHINRLYKLAARPHCSPERRAKLERRIEFWMRGAQVERIRREISR